MARTPDEKVFKDLIETEEPVTKYERGDTKAEFRFRVIEAATDPRIRLDIREYLRSKAYVGYTGRGITFTVDQVPTIISRLEELKAKHDEMFKPEKKKAAKTTKK